MLLPLHHIIHRFISQSHSGDHAPVSVTVPRGRFVGLYDFIQEEFVLRVLQIPYAIHGRRLDYDYDGATGLGAAWGKDRRVLPRAHALALALARESAPGILRLDPTSAAVHYHPCSQHVLHLHGTVGTVSFCQRL